MEVEKLYYEDCHIVGFLAMVTGCAESKGGWQVTLDSTAFYPEGGGQPCDLGTLGDAKVLDVREREGQILHLCDKPLAVGQKVKGRIDWERRFDFMQQHTGEHIVSGLIFSAYGFRNVGFHMGADTVTIDFDGVIPAEALAEIEAQANRVVWENWEIECWYPKPEALEELPHRSKKALQWPVRIVEIPDVDRCACCGVHVAATGEVGLIKLLSCVRFRQGVRIEMVCGGRALKLLSQVYEQNRQVSQAFSAKMLETGAAARRMNEQLAAEKYRCAGLEKQIFNAIAAGYAGKGNVVHFEQGLTGTALRELADRIAQRCDGVAAALSGEDGTGYNLCLVSKCGDVSQTGQQIFKALDGRGGGKAGFFQGTVRATREQIQTYFRESGWYFQI